MATFKKGILGGFSGTIGNVVGGNWNGIDYMRSKPDKVNNPNTPAQQAQRGKFGLMMSFLKKIKPVINAGFVSGNKQRTPFNRASSYNLKNAVKGAVPDQEIDFPALQIARGTLIPAEEASASSENPADVSFSWSDNSGMGSAAEDDEALLLLYNVDKERALYVAGDGPLRSEESFSMTTPTSYEGDTVEAFIAFVSADGTEASDSEYLGSITITEQSP